MWRWLLAAFLVGALGGGRAPAAPLPEDAVGRRAIRGAPADAARESDELRALREFDEASFPRPSLIGGPGARGDDDDTAGEGASTGGVSTGGASTGGSTGGASSGNARRVSLTGGVGPDAIRDELRSPEPARARPVEPTAAIPWLGEIKLPDLPVRLDPRTLRYLEFYKSDPRGRAIMASWLRKQGRWRALFEDALRRARLPLALIYVAMIESGYDPHDRSHAGAVGLWQFMPEGGKIYGLRIDYWVDERKNPERSTEAFTHYIADLKERFGAWPLALAAFNAGYGAVLRAMQKYNTNDYWELCRHEDGLPWDTLLYVPKAMAAAIVGENRKLFGYDELPTEAAYAFDAVSVPTSMSFAQIAKAAGTSVAEIETLNPELRRKRTPPEAWEARVPRGAGARFAANYLAHRELVKPFVVRFGERLDDLAREYGLTPKELRALNGVDDSAEVRPGLTLLVPDGKKPLPPLPCDTVIVAVPDKDAVVAGRRRVFYRTLPQDAIGDVAGFFKVKPIDLARWNHLDLDARLASGMVLQLWVAPDFDTSKAALVDPSIVRVVTTGSDEFFDLVEAKHGRARLTYVVKKGDDLKRIGKKFGLKVADLERINRFGAGHTNLTVGQKLTVYRAMTPAERVKAACRIVPGGADRAAIDRAAHDPPAADPDLDASGDSGEPREPDLKPRALPRPPPVDDRSP
ncbi:MAG TPA: LysM peptidoglycan-binding domain-containing protein [Polyangia bacterium]|nr:LysM peptidoglycan-binding domain-containing protein [Polyangia bacterium]